MSGPTPRIVLTRAAAACEPWRRRLEAAGMPVLVLPLLRHTPLPVPDRLRRQRCDWILFTSPRAVRAFATEGLSIAGARVGSVGDGTTRILRKLGIRATLQAQEQDGAGLARVFCTHVKASVSVLLPGPLQRLPEPKRALLAAGHRVVELPLYRTDPITPAELPEVPADPRDTVFFASPSAVRAWVAAWDVRPRCVAIGRTTAAACREHGFPTLVAGRPDLEHMLLAAGLSLSPATPPKES